MKKDDFVNYYNQLKDIYKSFKKVNNSWDGLFEDVNSKN